MATSLSLIPAIEQLSSRVIRVLGCNPGSFTLQGTNTYIIGTGSKRLLIDTGERENEEYLSNLKKALNQASLSHVVLTHWHGDHVGGLSGVLKDQGEDVKVSKFKSASRPDIPGVDYVQDGTVFQVEGATLKTIHTPGHTDDHMSLWLEEEKSIFSGDCVLGEGSCVFEDLHAYMASLQLLKDLQASTLYPGHGAIVSDPNKHIEAYIKNREKREEMILAALGDNLPKTIDEIVSDVYKELPANLRMAAAHNVTLHLKKLLKENVVEHISEEHSKDMWVLKSKY